MLLGGAHLYLPQEVLPISLASGLTASTGILLSPFVFAPHIVRPALSFSSSSSFFSIRIPTPSRRLLAASSPPVPPAAAWPWAATAAPAGLRRGAGGHPRCRQSWSNCSR